MRALALVCLLLNVSSAAIAHEGWGIVRDQHGRIYVADIPANTIWRIDRDGRVDPVLRDIHSHALVLGPDGAIYGSHVHLTEPVRGLWRLDMSGRMESVVPQTRGFPLDLQPFLIASDGTVYSISLYQAALPADQRQLFILRRSVGGAIDTIAGGPRGFADGQRHLARFTSIMGMAWLPDSTILLIDDTRVRRLGQTGNVTSVGPITEPHMSQALMGASVLDGRVFVADVARRRVLQMDSVGVLSEIATSTYWSPTGVLATPEGVYVLEHPRAPLGLLGDLGLGPYLRVRLYRNDGSTETLATIWGRHTKVVGVIVGGLIGTFLVFRSWRRA
jgi:DNA-binding beta-propeller fold protein YncE